MTLKKNGSDQSTLPDKYLDRVSEMVTRDFGGGFQKNDTYTLFIFEEKIGGLLCRNGIRFELFNDRDFATLASMDATYFKFISFDSIKEDLFSVSERSVTDFFIAVKIIFDTMYKNFTYERMAGKGTMQSSKGFPTLDAWLKHTLDERKRLFYAFLDHIKTNPYAPVELLAELI